jgi:glycosyltransferase 2 family protein
MRSERLAPAIAPASGGRVGWRRHGASLVSMVASGALLIALYRSLDVRLIGEALLRADRVWLVISIGMILPITVLRAMRFLWVAPAGALPGVGEALRLTLIASALNVFVPAKAGDLIKSYCIAKRSETPIGVAIAIAVYERLCDLFGLISWCLLGWLLGRPRVPGLPSVFWLLLGVLGTVCAVLISSERVAAVCRALIARALPYGRVRGLRDLAEGWPDLLQLLRRRRRWIVLFSLVLWFAHLVQIWLFTVALSASIPFTVCASLTAVALMAGQLPFTFAGLGARDVALVVLLSRYMAPESAAAMGILITTRSLLPPLMGVPIMWPYLSSIVDDARRWRREMEQAE